MTVEAASAPRRRLMAVMLADVVDYSRMMSRSEDETHARITRHVDEFIVPTIYEHNGRLVRSMGDGLLVEFVSAVDAVTCALDIQRGLAARQANEPAAIRLRIGINTGDVLVDKRDIYGNSVNIAARLEALASPGTVCVSQSIYDQTRAHPEFYFADRGAHYVKNIPYPVHMYEVAHERIPVKFRTRLVSHWGGSATAASIGAAAIALSALFIFLPLHEVVARTNAIVVLPFKNVGGNMADDYLADAITDELTTELSRLRRAWVISSGTALTYKDKPNDARQVGRELHVRYALEGSVKRAGPTVQVNAQLIDTESGTNLWANSFAYETSSLLALEDTIIGRIAKSLNDEVTRTGVRHEVGTLAADHNPLDERIRAMAAYMGIPTQEKNLETRQHAEAGLQADPDNARLLGLLASVLTVDLINGWNGVSQAEIDRAEDAAKKAISLDHNIPLAHHALGWVHRLRGQHQDALNSFNQAATIDPNFARAHAQTANEMVFLGKPKDAIPAVEKAIQLSPNDPFTGGYFWIKGRAYFALGDYSEAITALEESIRMRPNLWYAQAWLAAAYALANRDVEAQQRIEAFKQSFSTQSNLNWISKYYQEPQYQNPTLQQASDQMLDGLRKAGLK
jgi:class 3 adenylate cyclase/TolB-like protein/Flp pilus assembly protein TadD